MKRAAKLRLAREARVMARRARRLRARVKIGRRVYSQKTKKARWLMRLLLKRPLRSSLADRSLRLA